MARSFRSRDRQSFKPSEVVGLFILSLFGWMIFFTLLLAINNLVERIFGF